MRSKKLLTALLTAFSVLILATMLVLPASAAKSISKAVIKYQSSYSYTGSYIKPKVTVKLSDKTLSTSDYTVSYKNNKNVGKATITVKGKGKYSGTVSKSFYITPASLKKVKAKAYTDKITVSWSKGSGVTAYQVFLYNTKTKKWDKKATVKGTSATISNLQPGTAYKLKVRAYAKSEKYLYSPYTNLTVKTTLDKVSGIKFTPYVNSSKITWKAVKNATAYQVYVYNTKSSKWERKKTVKTNSVTLTGLTSATSYDIKIRAYNSKDPKTVYGAYSSVAVMATKPEKVKNVEITSFTSTTATLKWSKVPRVRGYYIYIGKTENPDSSVKYVKTYFTKDTTFKVTDLDTCRYYGFRILPQYKGTDSKNYYGEYGKSEMIFTPIAKVSSFKVTETTNTTSTVTWKAQPSVTGYYLYLRKKGESSSTLVGTVPANKTTYTFKGLSELTDYSLYIRAYYTIKDGTVIRSDRVGKTTKTDDGKVDGVYFTKTKSSIYVDYTYLFEAKVLPSYATNKAVTFSSSNTSVATVYSNGRVVGRKPGTATITVKTKDGGYTDSFKVKIVPLKSKSITVPSSMNVYLDEITTVKPTFSPEKTTDKSFTITGKDYTYTYKGGFLNLTEKTDTCKFSDYITVTANGQIIPKKLTIEPETGKRFSFSITVKANDTGVYDTSKLSVIARPLKVYYSGNGNPWVYSEKAQLTAEVSSSVSFTKDDLIWESSDTSVATVSSKGVVSCVGTGPVTITAYSPDKTHSDSFSITISPKLSLYNRFYSSCHVGDSYTIPVLVEPSSAKYSVSSLNEDIATVAEDGTVTIKGEGTCTVIVSSQAVTQSVIFTTKSWEKPEETDEALFSLATEKMNLVKSDMPTFIRSTASTFTDFVVTNSQVSADDLKDIFAQYTKPSASVIPSVSPSDFASNSDYVTARNNYLSYMPVANQTKAVLSGLTLNAISNVEYIDNNEPTYDIRFTLKPESIPNIANANTNTNHGKVFDILSDSYLGDAINDINSSSSAKVTYSSLSQYYNNCSVTVSIDKLTGNVEKIVYDMNIAISITNLDLKVVVSVFNSDLSFNVSNKLEIDVINN